MSRTEFPRTALITGAARRLGAAMARDLAGAGWAVAVHCHRSTDDAERVADEIETAGGRAAVLQADLTDAAAVEDLIERTRKALGPLGLLVNNASLFEEDDIASLTLESWDGHLDANLRAPALLSRDFARQAATGGLIVNILDQRVWRLRPDFLSYTVSKAGLWALTRTLAQALAPTIRVNAIGPGPALASLHQDEAAFERQWRSLPLARQPGPEAICQALNYLIAADSVTGQMIAVDAGQHLAWQTPDVVADTGPDDDSSAPDDGSAA